MADKILLSGLQYFSKHGAWEHEKVHGQRFIVDVVLTGDFRAAGASDELDKAVDYTAVYKTIATIMNGPAASLIEALGHRIATTILAEYPLVDSATVKLEKPGASLGGVAGSIGVEITRSRVNVAPMTTAYIGVGSNLGDRLALLSAAVGMMNELPEVNVTRLSSLYETAPIGPAQEDFLNAVVEIQTSHDPYTLLKQLLEIERVLGRVRIQTWGPRTVDCDIIYFEGLIVDDIYLAIPHPRAKDRAFVLVPLSELSPDLVLAPGVTVNGQLQKLDLTGVRRALLEWPKDLVERIRG